MRTRAHKYKCTIRTSTNAPYAQAHACIPRTNARTHAHTPPCTCIYTQTRTFKQMKSKTHYAPAQTRPNQCSCIAMKILRLLILDKSWMCCPSILIKKYESKKKSPSISKTPFKICVRWVRNCIGWHMRMYSKSKPKTALPCAPVCLWWIVSNHIAASIRTLAPCVRVCDDVDAHTQHRKPLCPRWKTESMCHTRQTANTPHSTSNRNRPPIPIAAKHFWEERKITLSLNVKLVDWILPNWGMFICFWFFIFYSCTWLIMFGSCHPFVDIILFHTWPLAE